MVIGVTGRIGHHVQLVVPMVHNIEQGKNKTLRYEKKNLLLIWKELVIIRHQLKVDRHVVAILSKFKLVKQM